MTTSEWDRIKSFINTMLEAEKEIWLEKQLLRNLILDSGWMEESELDSMLHRDKNDPGNLQMTEEAFASSEEAFASLGLGDWIAELERQFPRNN